MGQGDMFNKWTSSGPCYRVIFSRRLARPPCCGSHGCQRRDASPRCPVPTTSPTLTLGGTYGLLAGRHQVVATRVPKRRGHVYRKNFSVRNYNHTGEFGAN
jgi:hypothetical protein